jgi:hypothetical protein
MTLLWHIATDFCCRLCRSLCFGLCRSLSRSISSSSVVAGGRCPGDSCGVGTSILCSCCLCARRRPCSALAGHWENRVACKSRASTCHVSTNAITCPSHWRVLERLVDNRHGHRQESVAQAAQVYRSHQPEQACFFAHPKAPCTQYWCPSQSRIQGPSFGKYPPHCINLVHFHYSLLRFHENRYLKLPLMRHSTKMTPQSTPQ